MLKRLLIVAILSIATYSLSAQQYEEVIVDSDTLRYRYTPTDQTSKNTISTFGQRLYNYTTLEEGERINFSVTGTPAYSANLGWSLMAIGDIQYRTRNISQPQSLQICATASLTGYYGLDIDGINIFSRGKHRLSYSLKAHSTPTKIYGLDFATSAQNSCGSYTNNMYVASICYTSLLSQRYLLGAHLDYCYEKADKLDSYASTIIGDRNKRYYGGGVGATFGIRNSRTEGINLKRGIDITIDTTFRPHFISNNDSDILQINLLFDYYQPLWKNALLAIDIYGEYNTKNTPWMLRAELGDNYRMRGYYPGRYNDNTLITGQLELRQLIWQSLVIAAWGGVGSVFSPEDNFDTSKILPNYGAGIRWHLNTDTAIRFDVGFGRGCYNFILGLNEAF